MAHFTGDKTEAKDLRNFFKVTKLLSDRAGLQTQAPLF